MTAAISAYEAQRLENIKRNKALVQNLGIQRIEENSVRERPVKRQKIEVDARPSRTSARIATISRPAYNEDALSKAPPVARSSTKTSSKKRSAPGTAVTKVGEIKVRRSPPPDIDEIQAGWSGWEVAGPEPTRDEATGIVRFSDHPEFTPNKTPEEVLHEGCFGGSYFRPLYSSSLGITISDDWAELPPSWTEGLNVGKYLTSPVYDPEVNKYKVQAGLPIEEWEAHGWISHKYDVRGWFQWYYRFYMGRRCEDDARQISRWSRCAGDKGRWKLSLLRKYVKEGVKDVFDDGEDGADAAEVSPVQHQTCHHWAVEIRQDVLDDFWKNIR